jgi:hypothetical protein
MKSGITDAYLPTPLITLHFRNHRIEVLLDRPITND